MNIAIITLTTTSKRTGVAEYLINLIEQLQEIDQENMYFIFTSADNSYMFNLTAPNFIELSLPLTHSKIDRVLFYAWLTLLFPFWCLKRDIHLVHLPNTMFVPGFFPTITTVHDVTELKTNKYSKIRTLFRRLMILSAIRNSRSLITVSESSANDLRKLGAKNVKAIHLGFKMPFQTSPDAAETKSVLNRYSLHGVQYILFIGTLMKHKNVPALIRAFDRLSIDMPNAELIIVGAPGNDSSVVKKLLSDLSASQRVRLLSFVPAEDKFTILKHARIFCLISSYEGFGIPILEAQAAGVPVIATDVSSLPEIGGEGILLIDPKNLVESTADAITRLWNDNSLRTELVVKGKKNIERFSWKTFAEITRNEYLKIN